MIVVDLQNDFCHPEGPIGRHLGRETVNRMCSAISEMRQTARVARIPMIWVRTVHREATDSGPWLRRLAAGDPMMCREGSWGARSYKLVPGEQDVVVEKHRYSAFHGTELQNVLRRFNRNTIVLVGTATDVCVESTARDACMYDHDTVVVADATCAATEEDHAASLARINSYFGSVVESAGLIHEWLHPQRKPARYTTVGSTRDHGHHA